MLRSSVVRSRLLRRCAPRVVRPSATARCLATAVTPKTPVSNDSFLQSNNANYIDEMYAAWKAQPDSVHISWQIYFKNMDNGASPSQAFQAPPTIVPTPSGGVPSIVPGQGLEQGTDVSNHLKVQLLVRAYQVRGHHKAKIDPLGILDTDKSVPTELTLEHYGFTDADLDKKYSLGPGILPRFASSAGDTMSLRDIVANCERIYCGSYGSEYIHIPDRTQCDWLRERLEVPEPYKYDTEAKRRIMDRLIWGDSFERFLSTKHPNDKRFGLEGCEALIPGMKELIDDSVERGIESIVIGMPHRGRLNVLANVVRKPTEAIFSEFSGSQEPSDEGSGDVKYHLGMNYERPTPSGKRVNLSLVANPSHLEAEDPVVLGKTRAIQHFSNDEQNHSKAMGLLLHGDAAFAGQGVVYETIGMHALPGYSTGGTIHIVVNNQIGFTTDPRFARSTPYCSDIAKSIDAPIFHVNGDDVEAVTFICRLASEWRAEFKKDVVVDIVCYRKHGHNETDQPSFTQPLMYKKIAEHKPTLDLYVEQLTTEKTFTAEAIEEHKQWVWDILEENFQKSKDYEPSSKDWLTAAWNGFASPKDLATKILPHLPTAIEEPLLKHIGTVISSFPDDFTVHKNLKRIVENRGKTIEKGEGIDWATGEALAFGSLLKEGHHIRVSGQDVERGTFSQRHAVLHDQENEKTFVSLNAVDPKQAAFVIVNSHLSEFGTLGYEYGYSLSSPNALVIWEAQFGDFANNAQCIVDQFIASGENKWLQRSGLVMSLPHGYDGQGPEHSSARIERYLQLSNDDPRIYPSEEKLNRQHQDCNMQVVYPTTPANLFHVLRRQIHREFRKPLILFFSKALLRHPLAKSPASDFLGESHFQRVISETESIKSPETCRRLIICSGQVYVALVKARQDNKIDDIGIIRVEQYMPFPWERLHEELEKYKNAKEIVWCQEEPLNGGAWTYMHPRFETLLNKTTHSGKRVKFAGRAPTGSVATGNKKQHMNEQQSLVEEALDLRPLMD